MKERRIPFYIVVTAILGIIGSIYIMIAQSNIIFQKDDFYKKIVLEPGRTDAGYINLIRNVNTPSALEWAKFDNGENYIFFSVNKGEFVEERVFFDIPQSLEKGKYYVDYEVKYVSGQIDKGTIEFNIFP